MCFLSYFSANHFSLLCFKGSKQVWSKDWDLLYAVLGKNVKLFILRDSYIWEYLKKKYQMSCSDFFFFLGMACNFHNCSTCCYINHFGQRTGDHALEKVKTETTLPQFLSHSFWKSIDLKTIHMIHFSIWFENFAAISDFFPSFLLL